MADVFVYDAGKKIRNFALDCLHSLPESESVKPLLNAVEAYSFTRGINVKEARRRIAEKILADNEYKI